MQYIDYNDKPIHYLELRDRDEQNLVYDDVQIIVDPEIKDAATVDINTYIDKYILQCRNCGNLFPTTTILSSEDKCPICREQSVEGYIYKGKIKQSKSEQNEPDTKLDPDLNEFDYEDSDDNSLNNLDKEIDDNNTFDLKLNV